MFIAMGYFFKKIFEFLSRGYWIRPITRQWPLILFFIILIGGTSVTKNLYYRAFIIFFQAFCVAVLAHLTKSKVIKALIYILCYALFVIEIILVFTYGMHVSPTTLTLLLETDQRETAEFLTTLVSQPQFWMAVALITLVIIVNVFAERYRMRVAQWIESRSWGGVTRWITLTVIIIGLLTSSCYWSLINADDSVDVDDWGLIHRHPKDILTRLVISVVDLKAGKNEMMKNLEVVRRMKSVAPADSDSLNIIFVIGESYIKSHSSLYGYPLSTTPLLAKEKEQGRLFVFQDAVSPYNMTTNAVRNIVSCNAIGMGERWMEKPPLTAVFRQHGFHVSMYDNQQAYGNDQNTFMFSLGIYLFMPEMAKHCYDELCDSAFHFDGNMVECYQTKHQNPPAHKNLIVFHLMGQHVMFHERYPGPFAHFNADSIVRKETWIDTKRKETIAHYDNATYYNDFVISRILQIFSYSNTVVVYISDHGEEVYEYRDVCGRKAYKEEHPDVSFQYAVPLLVWCSDKFKELHPDIISDMEKALARPISTDNVCQLLFHLANINNSRNEYYNSTVDILSSDYHCPPRIIEKTMDYDSVMASVPKR